MAVYKKGEKIPEIDFQVVVNDPVNHPSHYTFGKFEVLDVIEDWKLNFHRGQVIKYIARAGKKDSSPEVDDLKKARFYLDREIQALEEQKP